MRSKDNLFFLLVLGLYFDFRNCDTILKRLDKVEHNVVHLNSTVQHQNSTIEHLKSLVDQQSLKLQDVSLGLTRNEIDVYGQRLKQLEDIVARQSVTINQLMIQQQSRTFHDTAAVYTVWGRKQCPTNSTELVYSGNAGGSYFAHSGAASEYVCLPPDPNYSSKTTYSGQHAEMYGGEYDNDFFYPNGNDVPCAVCRTLRASTVLMIPGKNTCNQGWNMEYYGYLASHHYSFVAASSFVCLHINPEAVSGGGTNYNGKLFQPVLGQCGSLPCPPYVNNYVLTCVVCSK